MAQHRGGYLKVRKPYVTPLIVRLQDGAEIYRARRQAETDRKTGKLLGLETPPDQLPETGLLQSRKAIGAPLTEIEFHKRREALRAAGRQILPENGGGRARSCAR